MLASLVAHGALAMRLDLPEPDPAALTSPALHVVLVAPSPAEPKPQADPAPPTEPDPEPPKLDPPERIVEPEPIAPEPPPQVVLEPPPPEPPPVPMPTPEPVPAPEPAPTPEPAPKAEPQPKPPPQPKPDPEPKPPPEPKPAPKPKPPPEPIAALEAKPETEPAETAMLVEPSIPSAAEEAASQDYFDSLRAYIEQHKRYPRRALMRRQEGTVLLRFTVDRNGKIVSHEIARSSGNPTLDREVEDMLERATPLPEIPDDIGADQMEIEVPVSFSLG